MMVCVLALGFGVVDLCKYVRFIGSRRSRKIYNEMIARSCSSRYAFKASLSAQKVVKKRHSKSRCMAMKMRERQQHAQLEESCDHTVLINTRACQHISNCWATNKSKPLIRQFHFDQPHHSSLPAADHNVTGADCEARALDEVKRASFVVEEEFNFKVKVE